MNIDPGVLERELEDIAQEAAQKMEQGVARDGFVALRLISRLARVVMGFLKEIPTDVPSFNHSRADGRFSPCPECLKKMTRQQLIELVEDIRERDESPPSRVFLLFREHSGAPEQEQLLKGVYGTLEEAKKNTAERYDHIEEHLVK